MITSHTFLKNRKDSIGRDGMYDLMLSLSNYIGMVGVLLLLIAYYAVSVERLSSKSMHYQILNFFGGWLILFSLFFHWNTPSVMIEIAWITISLIGMLRIFSAK